MPIYKVIKRHGEVYVYRGQQCIAVATAEGGREMEALVESANNADKFEKALRLVMQGFSEKDGPFYPDAIPAERANEIRELLGIEESSVLAELRGAPDAEEDA